MGQIFYAQRLPPPTAAENETQSTFQIEHPLKLPLPLCLNDASCGDAIDSPKLRTSGSIEFSMGF
jgi:hypothetical protein